MKREPDRWVQCTECGTLRPPSALQVTGANRSCIDRDWCRRRAAEQRKQTNGVPK